MRSRRLTHLPIVSALALVVGVVTGAEAQRQTFSFVADTNFVLGNSPRVEIENQSGEVAVVAGNTKEVKVTVRRQIPAADSASAETFLDASRVDYDLRGDRLRVFARVEKSRRERTSSGGLIGLHEQERGVIHLDIEVPTACDLEVSTASGEQFIRGIKGTTRTQSASGDQMLTDLRGRLWVASASGDVTISDCAADVNLEVTSGSIAVSNLTADGSLRSTSGDIRIRQARGNLSVTTTSGNVTVVGLHGSLNAGTASGNVSTEDHRGSVIVRTGSGHVELDLQARPGESANVRTGSGDVTLAWPPEQGCALEIYPGSGNLKDDFGVTWETRSRRAYRGLTGDEQVPVRIETAGGDIWLRGRP